MARSWMAASPQALMLARSLFEGMAIAPLGARESGAPSRLFKKHGRHNELLWATHLRRLPRTIQARFHEDTDAGERARAWSNGV
jgi:hypothetical protein